MAGYADSEGGSNEDPPRPYAYRYRDYVIRSMCGDKPFDRFVREQLAGDEMAGIKQGEWTTEQIELLEATGFLRMAVDASGGSVADAEIARNQNIAETLNIVCSSLMGLSVACAQCHDHRYDPIPHVDYYRLRAVFEPALDWRAWRNPSERLVSLVTDAERAESARIEAEAQVVSAEREAKQSEYLRAALDKELMRFEEPLRGQLRTALDTPQDKRSDEQKQLLAGHPSVMITPGVLYQYNQAAADELKKFDERIGAIRAQTGGAFCQVR